MGVPRQVIAAQAKDFGDSVTGYLCSAHVEKPYLVGVVFGDVKGRFKDGATIRTSPISRAFSSHGLWVYETQHGSQYVVCHWAHEGTSAVNAGAMH